MTTTNYHIQGYTTVTLSPDGQWMWDGKQWIPAPPTQSPPQGSVWTGEFGPTPTDTDPTEVMATQHNQATTTSHGPYVQEPQSLSPMKIVSSKGQKWNMPLVEQLTGFSGRINRQRYILYYIQLYVVMFFIGFFVGLNFYYLSEESFRLIVLALSIPELLIGASLTIQRLQDTGRGNGIWPILVFVYCAFYVFAIMSPTGSESEAGFFAMAYLAIFVPSVICTFVPGQSGPNQWGPNPLESTY